MMCSMNVIWTT